MWAIKGWKHLVNYVLGAWLKALPVLSNLVATHQHRCVTLIYKKKTEVQRNKKKCPKPFSMNVEEPEFIPGTILLQNLGFFLYTLHNLLLPSFILTDPPTAIWSSDDSKQVIDFLNAKPNSPSSCIPVFCSPTRSQPYWLFLTEPPLPGLWDTALSWSTFPTQYSLSPAHLFLYSCAHTSHLFPHSCYYF